MLCYYTPLCVYTETRKNVRVAGEEKKDYTPNFLYLYWHTRLYQPETVPLQDWHINLLVCVIVYYLSDESTDISYH